MYVGIHRFWVKYSTLITAILVFIAASTAFWLRTQQYLGVVNGIGATYPEARLDELDTFVNYWVVSYMDKNGPLSFYSLTKDNPATCLFWYPECRDIAHSELPGHIYTIYILYQLVKPLNISLYDLMALLPPVLGALGVIFAALAVKEVSKSNLAAIVSAFVYTLMFISREVSGFAVKYSFGLFTAPLSIWLHIRFVKNPTIANAVIAGLALAYAATVWTGAGLTYIPIYIFLALAPLIFDLSNFENFKKYSILFAVEILIPIVAMLGVPPYRGGRAVMWIAFLVAYMLYSLGSSLQLFLGRKRAYKVYLATLVVLIIGGGSLLGLMATNRAFFEIFTKIFPIAGKILLGLGINPGGVAETVAEYQVGHTLAGEPYMVMLLLTTVFMFIPIAIIDIIRKKDITFLTLAAWAFLSWYATYNTSYFSDYTKIASAVVVGIVVGRILMFSTPSIRSVGRIARVSLSFEKAMSILLALAVAIPSIYASYDMSKLYGSQALVGTMIARAEGFYMQTDVWLKALDYLRKTTPIYSLVVSWWDYGYWLSVIGNRSTVADGATISGAKIQRLAQYFVGNYSESYNILKEFGACKKKDVYIVIFSPVDVYASTDTQILYIAFPVYPMSFGDIPKFVSAIVYLGTGRWANAGLRYTTNKFGYDIYENEWIIQASVTTQYGATVGFISLNLNSTRVVNATLPRLFMWAVSEKLKDLYPGFSQRIVPAIIGSEGGNIVLYISQATKEVITFDYILDTKALKQDLYEVAYVSLSQPYIIKVQDIAVYRYVFVSILKLREDVLNSICT
jgi:dolichyl-diphosphooligosaccharide--protein glycosyltransferase